MTQLGFLSPEYPPGFLYFSEFISKDEEASLLTFLKNVSWKPYEMDGYSGKRLILSYDPMSIPIELKPLEKKATQILGAPIVHTLATWYPTGSQIGWHRDAPMYEKLLGVSLASECTMRLRAYDSSLPHHRIHLESRSAYVIQDEVRWKWEHHIPAVESDRYSLTFRTTRL